MLNYNRAIDICDEIIDKLKLDLNGVNVLTETGSGIFSITPFIAVRAGAHKVFVWTADSMYGQGIENILLTKNFLLKSNSKNVIEFALNKRPMEHVNKADLITNLGFVRPIDKKFIDNMRTDSVISYMAEAWEKRENDIDLKYCYKKGIKVAGTWENHPDIMIFNSVGNLAIKLAMEAGFEIYKNKIMIWSSDNFGKIIKKAFLSAGAISVQISNSDSTLFKALNKERYDFIFIADYKGKKNIIGNKGEIKIKSLPCKNIIHLCGAVDIKYAEKFNLKVYPREDGFNQRMSRTLAYLGHRPLIELHASGLKVGELLLKREKSKLMQVIV